MFRVRQGNLFNKTPFRESRLKVSLLTPVHYLKAVMCLAMREASRYPAPDCGPAQRDSDAGKAWKWLAGPISVAAFVMVGWPDWTEYTNGKGPVLIVGKKGLRSIWR
ncbi:MAG: hypothetical protein A2Y80_01530 [Deltaproteobacteria bacterium RBG_13_58_19]|nr:MAG: hypothetical protein A2Y80_01530 [Deltaproteobacteria bacterium RBG_13_58_19]